MLTPTELHVAALDREIAGRKMEIARIKGERLALSAGVASLTIRHAYLRFVRWFRSPSTSLSTWPLFVFAIGPLGVGVLSLVAINETLDSWPYAMRGFFAGMIVSALMFAALLYLPSSVRLPPLIVDAEIDRGAETSHLSALRNQLSAHKCELQSAVEQRERLVTSDKLKREMLLQRNWRAMRDNEWEEYLAEVCQTLGAKVQRTGRSGDQGVDLVVEFGPKRIAVQAKGYYNSVSGSAVQEAVAGVAHYGCNSSAVITNSRFTRGAKELAASNQCVLIGEDEFPNFVLGSLLL